MINEKKKYLFFFILLLGVFFYFQENTPCENKKIPVDINKSNMIIVKIIDNNKSEIFEKSLIDIAEFNITSTEVADENHSKSKILKDKGKSIPPPSSWNSNFKKLRKEIIYADDRGTYFDELDKPLIVPLGENDKPILTKNAIITKNGIYFLDELEVGDIIDGKEFGIDGDNIFLK